MISANQTKNPTHRFPEFKEDWILKRVGEVVERVAVPVKVNPSQLYQQIGIRSHGKGIFHKEFVDGQTLGNKRVFWVQENLFVVNIVFAWEQAVAKTTNREVGMIASHRFPMYRPIGDAVDLDFLLIFFLTKKGKSLLDLASPGGAGRNKTLGQKEFEKLKLFLPAKEEQHKIAKFLLTVEEKIGQLLRKKELLTKYKNGVTRRIFDQQIRFKDENGNDFADWQEVTLGEVLDYEQPTKYLVSDTEYDNEFETPVLTAGKTFILGYTNEETGIFKDNLPVIIFDDFTTANKFVDFPFKAKSSAMKILSARKGVNLRFIFEAMQNVDYVVGGHERHWISKYSYLSVSLPCSKEQEKIVSFLNAINKKIDLVDTQLQKTRSYKAGLIQQMFV